MRVEVNSTLAHYSILSRLGVGGMGEVYLAEDTELERRVALKVLLPEVADKPDRVRRFVREAKAASALNHPNILTVYQIGEVDGSRFIATEWVQGETLRDRMARAPLSVVEALDLAAQIATALEAAHRAGIIHRDIKPENVMVRHDGIVKVLDFGLAKLIDSGLAAGAPAGASLTRAGAVLGTVSYMSPEQTRGAEVDGRSDLFSLGVVLYEMLTGSRPFSGETESHIAVAILEHKPTPVTELAPQAPQGLDPIIARLMAKSPEQRYRFAGDFLADLRSLRSTLGDTGGAMPTPLSTPGSAATGQGQAETRSFATASVVAALPSPPSAGPVNSIAVLPFVNMSADPENEYFCDGLAEDLSSALSKLEDLKVVARTSAFAFRGQDASASTVGEALNVSTLLEGSVRRSGNRVRISVQLVNAEDGFHIWSERYDRQMEDIFAVQDEITLAVVDVLKVKLLGDERAATLKRGTHDPEAYQAYLQGRHFWNKRTATSLRQATDFFQQAINHDPTYALAYAGLAECYVLYPWLSVEPPRESMPKARKAAERAIEMDESVAEAHAALGVYLSFYEWNQPASVRELRRAMELNPGSATAVHWLGNVPLLAMGSWDESIAAVQRAQELDPLSPIIASDLGLSYFYARRFDEAVKHFERSLLLDEGFYVARYHLGQVRHAEGHYEDAISEYRRCLDSHDDPWVEALLARSLAANGDEAEASLLLGELLDSQERGRYVPYVGLAVAQAALGHLDDAFEWLARDIADRSLYPAFYKVDPVLDELRDDPRFAEVLRKVEEVSAVS